MSTKRISGLPSGSVSTLPLSGVTTIVHSGITFQHNLNHLRQVLVDSGSHTFTGSQTINGNLIISGSLTAQQYILSSSVTNIVTETISGSTEFGNSFDDKHNFTGSVNITGSLTINGTSYTAATSGTSGTSGIGTSGTSGTSGDSLFAQTGSFWATTNNIHVTGSLIVSGGFEVKNSGYSWSFNPNGTTLLPTVLTGDTSIGTTFNTNPPGHTLTIKHNGGVSGGSGGELEFDYGNAKIKVVKDAGTTEIWSFNSDGTTTFPSDTIDGGTNEIYIQSSNNVSLIYGALDGNWQSEPAQNQLAGINVGYDGVTIQQMRGSDGEGGPQWSHEWAFNKDGTTTFPNDIIDGGLNKVEIKSSNYVEMHYAEEDGVWQNFTETSQEAYVYADPDGVGIQNIRGNDGEGGPEWNHTWRFNKDGAIALPEGGKISEGGFVNNAIKLTPANGANENQALLIYPTAGAPEGNHIHLTANGGTTELYLGNDNHFVKLANSGSIDIQSYQPNSPYNTATWTFGTDGSISTTMPLMINVPNGIPSDVIKITDNQGWGDGNVGTNLPTTGGTGTGLTVDVIDGGSGYAIISINTPGTGYTNGDVVTVTNGGMSDSFTIVFSGTNSWEFDVNGAIVFPDATIQTTAFIPTTYATTGSNTFIGNQVVTGSGIFTSGLTITGSVNITEVINLKPLDPLPTGTLGKLAVSSSSDLYFHNGSSWVNIST